MSCFFFISIKYFLAVLNIIVMSKCSQKWSISFASPLIQGGGLRACCRYLSCSRMNCPAYIHSLSLQKTNIDEYGNKKKTKYLISKKANIVFIYLQVGAQTIMIASCFLNEMLKERKFVGLDMHTTWLGLCSFQRTRW